MKIIFQKTIDGSSTTKVLRIRIRKGDDDNGNSLTTSLMYFVNDVPHICDSLNELIVKCSMTSMNSEGSKDISSMSDKEIDVYKNKLLKNIMNITTEYNKAVKNIKDVRPKTTCNTYPWVLRDE